MEPNSTRASLPMRKLEGRRVNLSLANGSQLNDVEVVSAGRGGLSSLWVELDGTDLIIQMAEILDIVEVRFDQAA